jgi:peptidoglycan hydrolase-like protein with peptidoglycan-binding domain
VEDTTTTTVAEVTITDTACTISEFEISLGDMGESVRCAQIALVAAGYSNVEITGVFDEQTDEATREFQTDFELYIDGIIGKVTATELGVWPGLEAFIVRTPAPAPDAVDLVGMPLSPVASAGSDAPELPEDAGQGTGKRVVYQRSSQRVWAIDEDEQIVRSYLVSGSRYRNEVPGWHKVYSRSESALGWDLQADLPYMIRYTQTERGHIGFHAIPSWRDSGEKLQTIEELGQRLSGGCTRQAPQDAEFLWSFADVGTRVLVL